jgi:tRNA threonylcarbamoyl adenosine modification protein (Sua5/YciO/YrdC/YwlC family)
MAMGRAAERGLDEVLAALRAGQAVILPTDTVYGLAALPSVPGATAALFELKDRAAGQSLAVLVADAQQACSLAAPLPVAERLMAAFWPGPLTLVVGRRPDLVGELQLGGDPATIGVRCPDHDLVRRLASLVGPLAVTSANRHGEPTPPTAAAAAAALTGPVAAVLDAGPLPGRPSTVVDCTVDPWQILRAGPLSEADLHAAAAPG